MAASPARWAVSLDLSEALKALSPEPVETRRLGTSLKCLLFEPTATVQVALLDPKGAHFVLGLPSDQAASMVAMAFPIYLRSELE
jgi:hypothetical protein